MVGRNSAKCYDCTYPIFLFDLVIVMNKKCTFLFITTCELNKKGAFGDMKAHDAVFSFWEC